MACNITAGLASELASLINFILFSPIISGYLLASLSLIVANQNKEVKFLNVDWLDKELEMFTYEYNPKNRVIKYGATSGFHDDS